MLRRRATACVVPGLPPRGASTRAIHCGRLRRSGTPLPDRMHRRGGGRRADRGRGHPRRAARVHRRRLGRVGPVLRGGAAGVPAVLLHRGPRAGRPVGSCAERDWSSPPGAAGRDRPGRRGSSAELVRPAMLTGPTRLCRPDHVAAPGPAGGRGRRAEVGGPRLAGRRDRGARQGPPRGSASPARRRRRRDHRLLAARSAYAPPAGRCSCGRSRRSQRWDVAGCPRSCAAPAARAGPAVGAHRLRHTLACEMVKRRRPAARDQPGPAPPQPA